MGVDNIREMTERLLARYSAYDSATSYFKAYTLINNHLQGITIPTIIITAEDDPIIPVADFYDLHTSAATRLIVQPYGGHNGFLEGWRLNGWYEQVMVDTFSAAV